MSKPAHRHLPLASTAPPGRVFWRSLEERALGSGGAGGELSDGAERFERAGVTRREFVQLLGASAALAGGVACTPPREKILPYVKRPAELTPGVPLQFATSMVLDGYAFGLLVESHEGRPTKVEGNPEHPASLGATSVFEQASVLQLYDPDRARAVRKGALTSTFEELAAALAREPSSRLRLLLEPQSSPLLGSLLARLAERHPDLKITFDSAASPRAEQLGTALLFGEPLVPQYDFRRARVVLALDADFLAAMPFSVRWSREFADARRVPSPSSDMNRLYVVEPALTPTGMIADERLPARAREVAPIAALLLERLVAEGAPPPGAPPALTGWLAKLSARAPESARRWVAAAARDLAAHRGACAVIAGGMQPPAVHVLAQLANAALGNVGTAVAYTRPATLERELPTQSLAELSAEMAAGQVGTLLIADANPVYGAPSDLQFARALRKVPRSIHLSLYDNETSRACTWFVPAAHYLESWGDARAYDGTVSFVQPLIAPLWGGRQLVELLALLAPPRAEAGAAPVPASPHELLQAYWRSALGEAEFAARWPVDLQRGFLPDSAFPRQSPQPTRWDAAAAELERAGAVREGEGIELRFPPSLAVYDGRFANVAWLQELPDPATKLTWDNAALLSPRTARRLAVDSEDVIELEVRGRTVRAPVLIAPGHADESVTLHLGYGRAGGGEHLAAGVGVNASALRTAAEPAFTTGARVTRTGARHPLAVTQGHFTIAGRPIALLSTLAEYRANPEFAHQGRHDLASLLPVYPVAGNEWAMTIDMGVCTGCSSCVVACQAENNVPVVGKQGVLRGREMHWLRIDRYFTGSEENPRVVNQPMLCQHCEKAPCEYVCPVNATVHSPDGLNEMVYNRCVGTRFCSNNCPYKVRRFNWFDYTDTRSTQLQRNPNVTVRDRGVMEKCTYCVQRIRSAGIRARIEGRQLRPGEVVTACQQACPTRAIQFGSLAHENTDMVRWRAQPRAYGVLEDQGTQPRTRYLAVIKNPGPEVA